MQLGFDALFQPTRSTFLDQGVGISATPIGRATTAKQLDPDTVQGASDDTPVAVPDDVSDEEMSSQDDSRRKRKRSSSPQASLSPRLSPRPFDRHDSGHAVTIIHSITNATEQVNAGSAAPSMSIDRSRWAHKGRLSAVADTPRLRQATLGFKPFAVESPDSSESEAESEASDAAVRQDVPARVELLSLPKSPPRSPVSDVDVEDAPDSTSTGDESIDEHAGSNASTSQSQQPAWQSLDKDGNDIEAEAEDGSAISISADVVRNLDSTDGRCSAVEILSKSSSQSIALKCRVADIAKLAPRLGRSHPTPVIATQTDVIDAGFEQADGEKAEKALSHVLLKEDFGTMVVLGQYNKAFIIARRTIEGTEGRADSDDLFIIGECIWSGVRRLV